MKVLITDDSKIARKMTIKTLKEIFNEDIEILEGENGQEAIDLYKQFNPDIVFLDLTMPIIDGFEALKEIKKFDNSAKVIVVSADIQKESINRVIELGGYNFIKKPIDSTKMKQIFTNLIKLENNEI